MTSTDIMGVYPDNDMLVKEIGIYANSFKDVFNGLDRWSKSGVRELIYNAKQESGNMIEQSNFSMKILENLNSHYLLRLSFVKSYSDCMAVQIHRLLWEQVLQLKTGRHLDSGSS